MPEPTAAEKLAAEIAGEALKDTTIPGDPTEPGKVKSDSAAKDQPPRRGPGRPKGSKNKTSGSGTRGRPSKAVKMAQETDTIAQGLGFLLAVPAIPAQMAGHPYLNEHFNTAGPELAKALAQASEDNPVLRTWLLAATQGHSLAALGMAVFGYAAPPIVYFITENGNPARMLLGVADNPKVVYEDPEPDLADLYQKGEGDIPSPDAPIPAPSFDFPTTGPDAGSSAPFAGPVAPES